MAHHPAFEEETETTAARLKDVLRVPVSTYRVQLNAAFTFADLAAILPYLDALGVGGCYLSPSLKARPGSTHGYDVVDYRELNPELGTREQFEGLARDVRGRGMDLVLDTVPNHMAVDPVFNPYWRDLLQHGPSAESADWFDIDWHPAKATLNERVLLPILGDQYGVVLERGELQLALERGELVLRYFDHVLPIDPRTIPLALQPEVDAIKDDERIDERDRRELLSIMTAFQNLPPSTERDPERRQERRRESRVSFERFERLLEQNKSIQTETERALARLNGRAGSPESFDALHDLLERQPYRVAYWRTALDEINYRRFFEINELAAVRMEEPRVFAEAHELLLALVRDGHVTGLRLDHPDGLYDPEEYFERLQAAAWRVHAEAVAGAGRTELVESVVRWREQWRDRDPSHWSVRPLYLVAEKIVSAGEDFRQSWALHGGTGYRFLNLVNGLFIDRAGLHQVERVWTRLSGQHASFQEIAYESRRLIAQTAMASEMNMLAHSLETLATRDRRSRDFTLNNLRRALREVVASFPVYRTYVTPRGLTDEDRAIISRAVAEARRRSPVMEASIFEFIEHVLTGGYDGGEPSDEAGSGARYDEAYLRFAMRFQQVTGPIQAKGTEDTAFYRYGPLLAINEVGSDPASPSITVDQFHAGNRARLDRWPATMLTLATHDTKLGSDARARLALISERAPEWRRAVAQWMRTNARHRLRVAGAIAPARGDEYLFYQALTAVWPPELEQAAIPPQAPPDLDARVAEYMVKAIREAKIRSSWLRPDQAYEDAVSAFVRIVLTGAGAARFLPVFVPYARLIGRLGAVNSLAQLAIMIGVPGVPDLYQGSELWHLCLVDPDNRRPVDFAARRAMLDALNDDLERAAVAERRTPDDPLAIVREMAADWTDGRIKLWIAAAALRHRRRDPALFLRGEYLPIAAHGADTPVVAFARRHEHRALVVVVAHHASRLAPSRGWPVGPAWGERSLAIPEPLAGRRWRDLFTGRDVRPDPSGETLPLAPLLDPLPVAWLVSD